MKEKIKKEIKALEELYNYYLEKSDDKNYRSTQRYFEERCHDLRIEIRTFEKVLEMLENE